jgi:myosin protein heavy chain
VPDVKFHCPECWQKIAVDASAAGEKIECPACRSSLVIPASADGPIAVEVAQLAAAQKALAAAEEENTRHRAEGKEAQQEIRELRGELATAIADRERIRSSAEQRERELKSLRLEIQDSTSKLATAREQLEATQRERGAARAELAAAKESERRTAARLEELPGLREALGAAERARDDLKARLEESEKLKIALENTRKELAYSEEALAGALGSHDQLRQEAERATTDLGLLKTEVGEQLRDMEELGKRLAESERKRVELRLRIDDPAPAQALSAARQDAESSRSEVAGLRAQRALLSTELDDLRAELARRAELCVMSSAELETAQAERDRAAQESTKTRKESEQLNATLSAARREISDLQWGLQGARDDLAGRERELVEAHAALEKNAQARLELDDRIATTESAARNAAATLEAAASTLDTLQREAEKNRERLVSCAEERERQQAETANANRRMEELHRRIEVLESEANQGACELEQARKDLAFAHRERDDARARLAAHENEARSVSEKLGGDAAAARERAAELQRLTDRLQSEVEGARKNYELMRAQREEATRKLAIKEIEFGDLSAQIDGQKANAHALRQQLDFAEAAQERLRQLEAEHALFTSLRDADRGGAEKSGRISDALSSRAADQASAGSRESTLAEEIRPTLTVERDALKTELEATRAGLDRAKQHIARLQARRDQMQDEIAKLKVKLGLAPDALV